MDDFILLCQYIKNTIFKNLHCSQKLKRPFTDSDNCLKAAGYLSSCLKTREKAKKRSELKSQRCSTEGIPHYFLSRVTPQSCLFALLWYILQEFSIHFYHCSLCISLCLSRFLHNHKYRQQQHKKQHKLETRVAKTWVTCESQQATVSCCTFL